MGIKQGSTVKSDKFTPLCYTTIDYKTDDVTGWRTKVNEIHGSQDY